MIKKAVLLTLTASFLILFSPYSFSYDASFKKKGEARSTCLASRASVHPDPESYEINAFVWLGPITNSGCYQTYNGDYRGSRYIYVVFNESDFSKVSPNAISLYSSRPLTDQECSSVFSGSSVPVSLGSANFLTSGGSFLAANGACSVTGSGSVCSEVDGEVSCTVTLESTSTGAISDTASQNIDLTDNAFTESDLDFDSSESDYLHPLPGGCADSSNCVTIGDTTFLVDWNTAPEWFSYVDHNGNTITNPNAGGSTDPTDPDPTDPTNPDSGDSGGSNSGGDDSGGNDSGGSTGGDDSGGSTGGDTGGSSGGSSGGTSGGSTGGDSGGSTGGDTGGSDSGGSSDGGSTVPDFEFDESGIIEAIGSAGDSNQAGLDAVSNDVTGAIGEQTEETQGMFDGLGNTITNSLGLGTCYPDSQQTEEGHTAATSDKGLLGCVQSIANGMVNKLAEKFTEDVGDDNDLFNSSGIDQTLDGLAVEQQLYNDDVNTLMDEIGDGSSSDIANQITSRLPSLPSGSCSPLPFGPMEISCQAFNTIKLWLSWIVYFWTVVSVVDTFFRSGMRTA